MSDTHDHEIAKAVLYNHLSADTQDTVQRAIEDKAKAQDIAKEVKDEAQHVKKHAEDRAHEIAKNAKKEYRDSALQAALEVDTQKLRDRATLIEQAADLLQDYPGPSDLIGDGGAYLPVWCGFEHAVDATNNLNTATYQVLYMLNQCLVDMYKLRDNLNTAAHNYDLLDDDAAAALGGTVKNWASEEWDKAQGWYGDKKAKAQALADDAQAKVHGWEDAEKEKAKDWWQNKPEPEPEPEPETDPVTGQPLAAAAPPKSAATAPPATGESSNNSRNVSDVAPADIDQLPKAKTLDVPSYKAPSSNESTNDSAMQLLDTQCANIDPDHYSDIFEIIYGRSACIELPGLLLNPVTGRSILLDEFSDTWNKYIKDKLDQLTDSTNEYKDLFGPVETWSGQAADLFQGTIGKVSDSLSTVHDGCTKIAGRADDLNTIFSTLYDKHVSAEGVFDGAVQHREDLDSKYNSYMDLASTEDKKDDDRTDHHEDIHKLASASDTIANEFKNSLENLIDSPWKSSDVADIAPGDEKSNPENWPPAPHFDPVDPFDPQPFDPSDPFGPYGPFGPGGLIKPWKHRDKPDNPPDPVDPGHDFPHRLPDPGSDDDSDSSDIPSLPDDGDAATDDDLNTAGIPGMPSTGRTSGSGGPSVKAASYGGGGGGGGVPSMPLGPATPGEGSLGGGAPGSGAGAGAGAGAGRGIPAGAMGGMGGAPMGGAPGAGGKGQQEGKGKRGPQEDEALYTEDRAWTEAVIGNRPRKAATDNKGSK